MRSNRIVDMRICDRPGCGVRFGRTAEQRRKGRKFCEACKVRPERRHAAARASHVVQRLKRTAALVEIVAGLTPWQAYQLGRQHERDTRRFAVARAAQRDVLK